MRPPRARRADRPGASSTRPTTDSVSSTGHPTAAQTSTSPASSSPVIRSSSAEAVIRLAPARSSGRSRGDVRQPRLDDDRGPVGGRAGRVGGGDLQQVGVAVVHDPVLRPRQAAARATGPSIRCRRRGRGSPGGRLPAAAAGGCSTRSRDRASASAGSRRSSHSELTRICSTVIAPPPPGRLRGRTRWSTSRASDARRSRAARRRRRRSSASPSQARSAAPSAAGSPGGTSSPGRVPSAP